MLSWLTETTIGKLIATFFISMVPVAELRVGLPYGIAQGLPLILALLAAIVGNMVPVPFIVVYIKRIFAWLRAHWAKLDGFISRLERRAHGKEETVRKYGFFGLLVLVAVPLPGTGAWTGALVAALMNMRLKDAVPAIFVGVCVAAAIVTGITLGVIHIA